MGLLFLTLLIRTLFSCNGSSPWITSVDTKAASINPLTDPVYKPAGGTRVLRGGDYGNDAQYMRAANRADYAKTFQNFATGFRCVRSR